MVAILLSFHFAELRDRSTESMGDINDMIKKICDYSRRVLSSVVRGRAPGTEAHGKLRLNLLQLSQVPVFHQMLSEPETGCEDIVVNRKDSDIFAD
jgi:hypothetical protein